MRKVPVIALLLLWILGLVTGHTMGGFVHTLLVLAVIIWLIQMVPGYTAARPGRPIRQ